MHTGAARSSQTAQKLLIASLFRCKTLHFGVPSLPISRCSPAEVLDFRCLGYFRRPFTTPSEVEMTSLKSRLYNPAMIVAITILASVGAGYRLG
jgi:hypothetical protein